MLLSLLLYIRSTHNGHKVLGIKEIRDCTKSPPPIYSRLLPTVYDDDRSFSSTPPLSPFNSIPFVLHLQWKSRRIPAFALENFRAWKKLNPSWRLVLWTDDDLNRLAGEVLGTGTVLGDTFNSLPVGITRIDFLRYLILQQFGGVYADIDVRPILNFSLLLQQHSCVLAREPEAFSVSIYKGAEPILASNILMASRPGHPFWGVLMNRVQLHTHNSDPLDVAGPVTLTKALHDFATRQRLMPRESAVFLAPSMYFYPPSRPGGDSMHREMMYLACHRLYRLFLMRGWSNFAQQVCDYFHQTGKIDWTVPMVHPRKFNYSFTKHQMFNSWNANSASEQKYYNIDQYPDLDVTKPADLLKQISANSMGAFDYEKKVLSMKMCENSVFESRIDK